jgi:hypothetical protein
MSVCSPSVYLICGVLLAATPAFAHRPYERVAGTFQRSDGTAISIVRHYVDGIIVADPVSIQFRLPDDKVVAQTPHILDAVVRSTASGVEVYQYRTTWLPMATRVDSFDGYELTDVTSRRRARSILVHFAGRWGSYVLIGGLATFLATLWLALRVMAKGGWRAPLRGLGLSFVGIAAFFLAYDVLVFEPVSPLVLGGCGAVVWVIIRCLRGRPGPVR